MKILILSCNTGEGHNSAAAALREEFLCRGVDCETADALSFLSPRFSRLLCGIHTFGYRRAPKTFSAAYRLEEKHVSRRLFARIFHGTDALLNTLRQGRFDAVISVHVFAALMLTELRRRGEVLPPLYFVATDYTCSPGVGELSVDAWFIPHAALREEFCACGVPEGRIIPTGIPVCRCFREKGERGFVQQKLGLPEEGSMVLLCCGSMGCGPVGALAADLAEKLPPDAFSVVICGTNKTLRRRLERKKPPRTYVLGYTAEISLYMDAADLYLTKAGGLSTAEALEKGLPMLYVDAVGGCEEKNRRFMLERGFALGAEKNAELPALAAECLAHPVQLEEMQCRRGERSVLSAAERIADYVLKEERES